MEIYIAPPSRNPMTSIYVGFEQVVRQRQEMVCSWRCW